MRDYEVTIVLKADLDDEARNELIGRITGWITGGKEDVPQPVIEQWGERKLAYQIKQQNTGYYLHLQAAMEPAGVRDLERNMLFVPEILRHLVVRGEKGESAGKFDYKQYSTFRDYMDEHGHIMPRRRNRISASQQRSLARAVKRARHLAFLPYVVE